MKTKNPDLPRSIVIGGVITAATVTLAWLVQRKRTTANSADHLVDACECALRKLILPA